MVGKMKFISLSNFPGKTGQYYYTSLFRHFGISATYTPIGTYDLKQSINDAIESNVTGISISMPFKQEIIQYLDDADPDVVEYQSCNTVKIQDGKLYGYNCDLAGVEHVSKLISGPVTILGNGAIGQMFNSYLQKIGHVNVKMCSRDLDWEDRHSAVGTIINCTPYGTANTDSPLDVLPKNVIMVIDMALTPGMLATQCNDINYVSGTEFYKYQFLKQFETYTNIKLETALYEKFETKPI